MQVIHVHADSVSSEYDTAFIRMVVGMIEGVRDIATVPSLGLISVLYDDRRSDATDIVEAVCSAGFDACQCRPRDVVVAAVASGV
jgi:hypothetical protein